MSPLNAFRASPQFTALLAERRSKLAAPLATADPGAGFAIGTQAQVPPQPVPPTVPERLREKIMAVDLEKLKVLDQEFHGYAELVVTQTSGGRPPDKRTLKFDIKHLPLIVEMENHRRPDLNLHVCSTWTIAFSSSMNRQERPATSG